MANGLVSVRKPDLTAAKYNSKTMIGIHEIRQFLEPLGPYALINVDNQAEASMIVNEGYTYKVKGDEEHPLFGTKWYAAGGYVRDDGAVFVMLPEKISDKEFFSRQGLHIDLLGKHSNAFKTGKYLKRLYSHHANYMQGDVIRESGDVIWVKLANNVVLSVRYAEGGVLTDGMNLISTKCLDKLGFEGKEGSGLRITALSPRGFSKGHAIVKNDLQFDLVLYDSKQLLKGDKFTFALDNLHEGNLFTDTQSVINFRMYRSDDLLKWSEVYMRQVIEAVQNEDKFEQMLQKYKIEFHIDEDGEFKEGQKEADWALLRALRTGIHITEHPALQRKVFHLFINRIMDFKKKIRIPVPEEVGRAAYILVDPTIFDTLGNPSLPGVLQEGQVYVSEHEGPVVFHRQPNAHRGEHYIGQSVNPPSLAQYGSKVFMFVAKESIEPACVTLGGGDQDDRVVIYTDPSIVSQFKELESDPYPLEVIKDTILPMRTSNRFFGLLPRPTPVYDRHQIDMMLSQQEQQRTSIGQAVNPIMIDTVLTDQKEYILGYLAEIPKDLKVISAIKWVEAFGGNMLRRVASRLEQIIDAVKKDGGDVSMVAEEIREFWKNIEVFPEFATRGGFQDMGRLPASRRGETHPVVVRTEIDDLLDAIDQARVELEDVIIEIGWQSVGPVPLEIITYPVDPSAWPLALEIRTYYHARRMTLMANIAPEDADLRIAAIVQCDKDVYDAYSKHPLVLDAMINLYGMTYSKRLPSAPVDKDGRAKPYADGLLWGPRVGGLMVQALDRCDMTVRYVKVQLFPGLGNYRKGKHNVTVLNGVVTLEGSNTIIGNSAAALEGPYEMVNGLIGAPASTFGEVKDVERTITLTVVDGWKGRIEANKATRDELADWKSNINKKVVLKPYEVYKDADGVDLEVPRDTVEVLLDGKHYGYIVQDSVFHILKTTEGYLIKGKTPMTMDVIVVNNKVVL